MAKDDIEFLILNYVPVDGLQVSTTMSVYVCECVKARGRTWVLSAGAICFVFKTEFLTGL